MHFLGCVSLCDAFNFDLVWLCQRCPPSDRLPDRSYLPATIATPLQKHRLPPTGTRNAYIVYTLRIANLTSQQSNYSTLNTFTAIVDLSRFNNSCLKSPASILVDLSRSNFSIAALRSFSLNQLRNLSLQAGNLHSSGLSETAHSPSKHKDKHGFIISQCKHTEL